jgi:hypothetical protein
MSNISRTYRYPYFFPIFLVFGAAFFAFMEYLTVLNKEGLGLTIAFAAFSFACVYSAVSSIYSVTVTEKNVSVRRYFRTKTLAWNDIDEITPGLLSDLHLKNRDGDVTLLLSAQLNNFFEIVYTLKEKCPNAWMTQTPKTFHQSPWAALLFGLIGMCSMAMGIGAIAEGTQEKLWTGIVLGAMGFVPFFIALRVPRRLTFEDAEIAISYLAWERRIQRNEIKHIKIEQNRVQNILMYFVHLELKNGKKILLSNYKEGMITLIAALEIWIGAKGL